MQSVANSHELPARDSLPSFRGLSMDQARDTLRQIYRNKRHPDSPSYGITGFGVGSAEVDDKRTEAILIHVYNTGQISDADFREVVKQIHSLVEETGHPYRFVNFQTGNSFDVNGKTGELTEIERPGILESFSSALRRFCESRGAA